jgi:hypothetical protein
LDDMPLTKLLLLTKILKILSKRHILLLLSGVSPMSFLELIVLLIALLILLYYTLSESCLLTGDRLVLECCTKLVCGSFLNLLLLLLVVSKVIW